MSPSAVSTGEVATSQLIFKAILIEMDKKVLVEFRLSKGDGIEFKRRFSRIREVMEHLIMKGPILWSFGHPQ